MNRLKSKEVPISIDRAVPGGVTAICYNLHVIFDFCSMEDHETIELS